MKHVIGLYGTGGCARGLMPILRQSHTEADTHLVFIDDGAVPNTQVNGHDVLQSPAYLALNATRPEFRDAA